MRKELHPEQCFDVDIPDRPRIALPNPPTIQVLRIDNRNMQENPIHLARALPYE